MTNDYSKTRTPFACAKFQIDLVDEGKFKAIELAKINNKDWVA